MVERTCDDYLDFVRQRRDPIECNLKLPEGSVVCEIAGMDNDVGRRNVLSAVIVMGI
jgi:hypothetical protein